jgi:outer membrane biosynthesis protein TonB
LARPSSRAAAGLIPGVQSIRWICGPAACCSRLPGTLVCRGGVPRAVEKVSMTRSSPAFRAISATAAAGVLALSVGLSAVGAAHAESPTPTPSPTCVESCETAVADPAAEVQRKPEPKPPEPPQVPGPPVDPGPPAAPQPAAPAPEPAPTLAPESSPAVAAPSTATTNSTGATPAPAGPSTASNWNTPATKSAKPTAAAAVNAGDGPGFGDPGLPAIIAGVVLVGLGGLAFAWWSRSRLSAH